jgi:glycosyltransferase involved in cell wall biosynthesis
MQIGIDIRSVLKKTTGIGKYTLNLINAFAEVDSKNNYYLYSRKKILDFKRRLPTLPGANFSHCIDYFKRGPDAVLPEIDIFHTSSYDLPKPKNARYIITIHDVIIKAYPYGHREETIREMDERLKRILDEADVFVADSNSTKTDLMKFYGVDGAKVEVIYPGVSKQLSAISYQLSAPEQYILFVGTLEPRKNVDGLIRAFDWLRRVSDVKHKLYIVGMKGWMFEDIFKTYDESEFKKDIIFKGYVNDTELRALYQGASVFVYPSFYEGFGLPVVEAFSYGVPVVTSNASSCSEVAGEAALLIEPSNYKEIGEAILKLINDKELRETVSRKAIDRAKEFSWARTAEKFLTLFTQGRV